MRFIRSTAINCQLNLPQISSFFANLKFQQQNSQSPASSLLRAILKLL